MRRVFTATFTVLFTLLFTLHKYTIYKFVHKIYSCALAEYRLKYWYPLYCLAHLPLYGQGS